MTDMALPSNVIPYRLSDVMRWAPTYHSRKMAIISNFNKGSECYLICGKLLCDSREKADWKHDGSGATNFYQWVDRELGHKVSNVKRMMKVWSNLKHLVPGHGELLTQIEFSKLVTVASHVKNMDEEQQVEILHVAQNSNVRDLDNNIRELTGNGIPTDTCAHTSAMEMWYRCPDCGKFIRAETGTPRSSADENVA